MQNISPAMRKHYMSMFRKFKARVRVIDNAGLDLDIVNSTMEKLKMIGIEPMQSSLSLDDIAMLSNGTILETFLENKLSLAKTRKKVLSEISSKIAEKYDDLSSDELSSFANFLTTSSYAVAVSLGIMSSDIIADIYSLMGDSIDDVSLSYVLDGSVNSFLRGEIKNEDIYQDIINNLEKLNS